MERLGLPRLPGVTGLSEVGSVARSEALSVPVCRLRLLRELLQQPLPDPENRGAQQGSRPRRARAPIKDQTTHASGSGGPGGCPEWPLSVQTFQQPCARGPLPGAHSAAQPGRLLGAPPGGCAHGVLRSSSAQAALGGCSPGFTAGGRGHPGGAARGHPRGLPASPLLAQPPAPHVHGVLGGRSRAVGVGVHGSERWAPRQLPCPEPLAALLAAGADGFPWGLPAGRGVLWAPPSATAVPESQPAIRPLLAWDPTGWDVRCSATTCAMATVTRGTGGSRPLPEAWCWGWGWPARANGLDAP